MNKFESSNLESPEKEFEEYEDLIKQYEGENVRESFGPKEECGPHIEEFEEILTPLLKEELLELLNNIEIEEEAMENKERESVKEALIPLVEKMNFLKKRTDIGEEEFEKLHEKYKIISRAVGMINGGNVDHNR
ncbi:hypothetical protein KKA27_00220 [Patescibacteria group bacterium]|nr:hypothetical protein [Patescibacteria group bacterium]